jgi:hypothetical protein
VEGFVWVVVITGGMRWDGMAWRGIVRKVRIEQLHIDRIPSR